MSVLLSKLMVKPSFSKAFWPSMYQKAGITEAAFSSLVVYKYALKMMYRVSYPRIQVDTISRSLESQVSVQD